jgi:hypothetical protein
MVQPGNRADRAHADQFARKVVGTAAAVGRRFRSEREETNRSTWAAARADGHANPDFAYPLAHGVGRESINPGDGKHRS